MGYIGAGISRFNTADELTVTGDAEFNGNANFGDSDKVSFSSGKLEMYHDGTNAYIDETYANGTFLIRGNNISLQKYTGETMIQCVSDGKVELNFNNVPKLETTSSGVSVTGGVVASGGLSINSYGDPSNNYITLRPSFAPSASGGVGFAAKDHDGANNDGLGVFGHDGISFTTGGSERARLDSSGNLLVGNSTFGAEDGVYISQGGNYVWARSDDTSGYFDRTGSDGKILELRKDGTGIGTIGTVGGDMVAGTGDTGLRFHDGADQVYPSNTNGSGRDAAIDLGNSGARFKDGYFNGTLNAGRFAGKSDSDTFIDFQGSNVMQFFTGNAEKARITASSTPTILVGCTVNPSASAPGSMVSTTDAGSFTSFSPANTASTHAVFGNLNGAVGTIQTTNSTTAYNTSSDRRLKYNIEDAASASDKIDAIQVRQFDWNADESHQDYGLIAQELQPIEPLAVTGNADSDEMMGVDYSKLVPMLIKEIQELRGRVAALEAS